MPQDPHSNDNCRNCRYYAQRGALNIDDVGECIRYAPLPDPSHREPVTKWPLVRAGDWCGDWSNAPGQGA